MDKFDRVAEDRKELIKMFDNMIDKIESDNGNTFKLKAYIHYKGFNIELNADNINMEKPEWIKGDR